MVTSNEPAIREMLKLVMPEMKRCFKIATTQLEDCEISNQPSIDAPTFFSTAKNPNLPTHQIVLCLERCDLWNQAIYQLAHELAHYFLYLKKTDKLCSIPWIEETICESIALYILYYTGNNWAKCSLSKKNFKYLMAMKKYLADILSKKGTGELSMSKTVDQLQAINDAAEQNRNMRLTEVLKLYAVIKENPQQIVSISNYTEYLSLHNPLLLDVDKLLTVYGKDSVIKCLISIQPIFD